MTEFSEWLKAYEYELPLELQIKAKECLELEKEQIIEAWIATDNELQRLAAEEYYKQNYQNK